MEGCCLRPSDCGRSLRAERGCELPAGANAGSGRRRSDDRQDDSAVPWHAGSMHAMPQPPVQRLEAGPILAVQQLLPTDGQG